MGTLAWPGSRSWGGSREPTGGSRKCDRLSLPCSVCAKSCVRVSHPCTKPPHHEVREDAKESTLAVGQAKSCPLDVVCCPFDASCSQCLQSFVNLII